MRQVMVGMLAETFIHPGIGQAISAIDLPVARERVTDYPFIPGSGKKGGWKTWAKEQAGLAAESDTLFGKNDNAGAILFSDARLALLPVRSLNTAYVWLTCPLLLERLERDAKRAGPRTSYDMTKVRKVGVGKFLGFRQDTLTLEERDIERQDDLPDKVADALGALAPAVAARIVNQLAIVHDDDFAWFAKYALPVSAHNQLDENKTSKNLWYEETLPPDTVMYSILAERPDNGGNPGGKLKLITDQLAANPYCQFGGNETLGQGWFQLTVANFAGGANA